jgi:hypothetical protein
MKLICAILGILLASMCDRPAAAQPMPSRLVEIVQKEPEDRGAVALGGSVSRSVILRNVTGSSLNIAVRQRSCGCLNTTVEPAVIQPGETCKLSVSLAAAGSREPQRYFASFRATTEGGVVGGLPLAQEVVVPVAFRTDFAFTILPHAACIEVQAGQGFREPVYFHHPLSAALRVHEPTTPWGEVALHVPAEPASRGRNAVWKLELVGRFDTAGTYEGMCRFRIDDAGQEAAVPVLIRVRPVLAAIPAGAVFSGAPEETAAVTIRIPGARSWIADGRAPTPQVAPSLAGVGATLTVAGDELVLVVSAPQDVKRPSSGTIDVVGPGELTLARVSVSILPPATAP